MTPTVDTATTTPTQATPTFTKANEVLIVIEDTRYGRIVAEHNVSKIYDTALDALAAYPTDDAQRFGILDVLRMTIMDVTEAMAEAYIHKFDPLPTDSVPPFVETSQAWTEYVEDLERPTNQRRAYGTINHEQTGVK